MVKWWVAASPLLLTMQPLALTMQPSALPAPAEPMEAEEPLPGIYHVVQPAAGMKPLCQHSQASMRDLDGFAHVCAAVLWLKADRNGCLGGGE